MRLAAVCVAMALAVVAVGCSVGAESRPMEFLTLDAGAPPRIDGAPAGAKSLRVVVERFRAPEIYEDARIGWREGARIQHFKFCRWAGPPSELLQQVFVRALQDTARFEHVERSAGGRSDAEFSLAGEIDAIYFTNSSTAGQWELRIEGFIRLVHQDPAKRGDPGTVMAEWPLVEPGKEGAFVTGAVTGDDAIPKALSTMVEAASAHFRDRSALIAKEAAERIAAAR